MNDATLPSPVEWSRSNNKTVKAENRLTNEHKTETQPNKQLFLFIIKVLLPPLPPPLTFFFFKCMYI